VPSSVEATIKRAMAKEPSERFTNPSGFAAALTTAPPVEPMPDYSRVAEPVTRSTRPVAGRQKEVADLTARLDALGTGRSGFVLLGGEPGVGKTKLAEAALLDARQRGWFSVVGHCYEMEGAAPYLPFLEQLEYVSRVVPPGRFRMLLGDGAGEMARVMPAIRQLYTDIPEPLELPPEQQRRFLFTRMHEYVERASRNVPIVFLFDDLHWADESTLMLLEHLAQHLASVRVLLIGTYRDVELDVTRPFAKTLERLTRQRLAERIIVRRMPQTDVAEMLALLGAPEPPPALVSAIYKETEGNPFFVEEVFQHLREEGRLLDANGQWLANIALDELRVPESVRLVIGRRLERVSAECRTVLTSAAVVGPRFTLEVLEALAEQDADAILDALEQAEAAGLILSHVAGRQTHYTYAHELIRQTLLASLSMPRRQRRHQKTADAIEKAYAGKLESHVSDLAYHLFQAGAAVDSERTTRVLLAAARHALAAGAFNEALGQVEKALSVLETQGDRRHADVLLARGEALRGLGKWRTAVDTFHEALAMYESQGAVDETVAVVLAMADVLIWTLPEHKHSSEIVQRALARIPEPVSHRRVALMIRYAYSTGLTEGYEVGIAQATDALRMAIELGDEALAADARGIRGSLGLNYGFLDDAHESLTAAYPVLARLGKRWESVRYHANHLRVLGSIGKSAEAFAEREAVMAEALELGHIGAWFLADVTWGPVQFSLTGDAKELERYARRALVEWESLGPWHATAPLWLSMALHEQGAGDDPASLIAESGMWIGNEGWGDVPWGEYFAQSAETRPSRAREVLAKYEHRLPRPGDTGTIGKYIATLRVIRGLAILDERARAAELYPQSAEILRRGVRVDLESVVEMYCGIAAAAGERWEVAEEHFTNAMALADEMPHVIGQGEIRRWHAWMLLARQAPGDVERAQTMLREAVEQFERLKLTRRERACRELLAHAYTP
jgi:eukaryotic-like serine/threonine-protein kinase